MTHYPFPKIPQFASVVKRVRGNCDFHGTPYPTLRFLGTPKVHGSNVAMVVGKEGVISVQSRNRVITPEDDAYGFAAWVSKQEGIRTLDSRVVVAYGEWFGQGVQKGVGVSSLEKQFMLFYIAEPREEDGLGGWKPLRGTSNSLQFGRDDLLFRSAISYREWYVDVDFAKPEEARNKMVEWTLQVEAECPVARAHGIEGGVGEGIVWHSVSQRLGMGTLWFKTKGEKHSATKVKTLKPRNAELDARVAAFADATVTGVRVSQGTGYLAEMGHPLNRTSTGHFLKWIQTDIAAEEGLTLEEAALTWKDVGKAVQQRARQEYFKITDAVPGGVRE